MAIARSATDLGKQLRSRRRAIHMSQGELAQAMGVSRKWVIDFESGHPRAALALVIDAFDAVGAAVDIIDNPLDETLLP